MNTKALRQKVLDLAIHGKLVPQNPNDESAEVLLKKIREEKAEKIKKGELKADKKDSFIFVGSDKRHYEQFADGTVKDIEDEIPFEVPEGWAWCRLEEISSIISKGTTPKGGKSAYCSTGINYLRVENIRDNGTIDLQNISHITESEHIGFLKRSILQENDLIISIAGTLGKTAIVRKSDLPINTNQAIAFVRIANISSINLVYLRYVIESSEIKQLLLKQTKVTSIPNLTLEILSNCFIPLPPLAEQEQIISKIVEIFAQIDYLEKNKTDLETEIKQAKSKILDLAIHGKLVPQDPADEPAEKLLKRIATSDNRPYKKFDENESEINIPTGWFLCKLKDVCTDFIVPQRDKPKVFDGNIPWCRIEDIEGKYLNGSLSGQLVTEETIQKMNMHKCPVGSIICSCSASLGIQAITTVECCTNQTFIGIVPNNSALFNEYLYYLLKAQTKYFHEIATGTTIKG